MDEDAPARGVDMEVDGQPRPLLLVSLPKDIRYANVSSTVCHCCIDLRGVGRLSKHQLVAFQSGVLEEQYDLRTAGR